LMMLMSPSPLPDARRWAEVAWGLNCRLRTAAWCRLMAGSGGAAGRPPLAASSAAASHSWIVPSAMPPAMMPAVNLSPL
jgi:hypothetical protein